MIENVIAATDNDKTDRSTEIGVLESAGYNIPWFNCKTEDDVIEHCKGFKVLINQYAPMTRKVFENLPKLKVIVRYGVGVDNVDLLAASEHKVSVCNVPDYGVAEVADHAVALSLALARKIVLNNDIVKHGDWGFNPSRPIFRFSEQTVGVVGLGRIGLAYAKRMRGMGFKVIAANKSAIKRSAGNEFIEEVNLEDLIKLSDIISIHCPLDGNKDLFSADNLSKMKKTAFLINVSRGGIINESDLYDALKNKTIAGAAVDVTEKEPIQTNSPLLNLENFIITPHIAWYSESSGPDLNRKVAEESVRGAKDEPLQNVVNRNHLV